MARYLCATPTFTTDSFHHDTMCLYGKTTCTVKEGLFYTRIQNILNLTHSYYVVNMCPIISA